MKYLWLGLLLAQAGMAEPSKIVMQEVYNVSRDEGMRHLYLEGWDKDEFALLDCHSFIHEISFFVDDEMAHKQTLSNTRCEELYEEFTGKIGTEEKSCIVLDTEAKSVTVEPYCYE